MRLFLSKEKSGGAVWVSIWGKRYSAKAKEFTTNSFVGLPLTTHGKNGSWYVEIGKKDSKDGPF